MTKESIIVDLNNFALNTDVFILKDDGSVNTIKVQRDINNLAQVMADLAYANNIYSLRICGSSLTYTELKECIEQYEQRKYSQNKIDVEIM